MTTVTFFPSDADVSNGDIQTTDLWGNHDYWDAHDLWPGDSDYVTSHGIARDYLAGGVAAPAQALEFITVTEDEGAIHDVDPLPDGVLSVDATALNPVTVAWVIRARVVASTTTFGPVVTSYPNGHVLSETRDDTIPVSVTGTLDVRISGDDPSYTYSSIPAWGGNRTWGPEYLAAATIPLTNAWTDLSITIASLTSLLETDTVHLRLAIPAPVGEPLEFHYDLDLDTAVMTVTTPTFSVPNLDGAVRGARAVFS